MEDFTLCRLTEKRGAQFALRLNANPPDWYKVPFWIKLMMASDWQEAIDDMEPCLHVDFFWCNGMILACYGHFGMHETAKPVVEGFKAMIENHCLAIGRLLNMWNFSEKFESIILEGWKKAGLDVSAIDRNVS